MEMLGELTIGLSIETTIATFSFLYYCVSKNTHKQHRKSKVFMDPALF